MAGEEGKPGTIGFIGLGRMGTPMAHRLLAAGGRLQVYDANPAQTEAFAALDQCRITLTPSAAAVGADAVILMLPDGKVVRDVVLALMTSLSAEALLIDMSSSDPYGTRELGATLAQRGRRMIDAPVSGGVRKAETGELAIMVGGAAVDVEAARGVLASMGSKIFHVGALGAGQAMKALNNMVSASGLIAVVEALKAGERFGLDPARMVEVLNASTGRNNTTENKVRQFMLNGRYDSGFALSLMVKDVATAGAIAAREAVPIPANALCLELCRAAQAGLPDRADHTELHRWFEGLAGDN